MRPLAFLGVLLSLSGCARSCPTGFCFSPGSWRVTQTVQGPAEFGYGAAVALDEDLWVGAPWRGTGALFKHDVQVRTGTQGSFLAAGLAAGLVGVPGSGRLESHDGVVLHEGLVGLGTSPVWHRAQPAAIARGEVWSGAGDGFALDGRAWALASMNLGDGERLVAALTAGGLRWREARSASVRPVRALMGCDVDQDGDDELVVADPTTGSVHIYLIDSMAELNLDAPTRSHSLGVGSGFSLACVHGGVLVGAPDHALGSQLLWINAPLEPTGKPWTHQGGTSLGHAMGVGKGRIAVGDPGAGRVLLMEPRRRR